MKTLIVEDDFTSRLILQEMLKQFGPTHIAVDGQEGLEAVRKALGAGEAYDLICLDIMMPKMDGQEALRRIRQCEEEFGLNSTNGAKIIMTTALGDPKSVIAAFKGLCDSYLQKPIQHSNLMEELKKLGLAND